LGETFAQSGYYYQSTQSGSWSDRDIWQRWSDKDPKVVPLGSNDPLPNSAANEIKILTNHDVIWDNTNVSVDQLVVDVGGTLTIGYNQKLTLANGAGTDLTVLGSVVS